MLSPKNNVIRNFSTSVAGIAQPVEQGPEKPCVRGSIPRPGTIFFTSKLCRQ